MTETVHGNGHDLLVELTADIVSAYVSNHVVPVGDLCRPDFRRARGARQHLVAGPGRIAVVEKQKPGGRRAQVSVRTTRSSAWNAAAPSSR